MVKSNLDLPAGERSTFSCVRNQDMDPCVGTHEEVMLLMLQAKTRSSTGNPLFAEERNPPCIPRGGQRTGRQRPVSMLGEDQQHHVATLHPPRRSCQAGQLSAMTAGLLVHYIFVQRHQQGQHAATPQPLTRTGHPKMPVPQDGRQKRAQRKRMKDGSNRGLRELVIAAGDRGGGGRATVINAFLSMLISHPSSMHLSRCIHLPDR
jgi:hypothetical protein